MIDHGGTCLHVILHQSGLTCLDFVQVLSRGIVGCVRFTTWTWLQTCSLVEATSVNEGKQCDSTATSPFTLEKVFNCCEDAIRAWIAMSWNGMECIASLQRCAWVSMAMINRHLHLHVAPPLPSPHLFLCQSRDWLLFRLRGFDFSLTIFDSFTCCFCFFVWIVVSASSRRPLVALARTPDASKHSLTPPELFFSIVASHA